MSFYVRYFRSSSASPKRAGQAVGWQTELFATETAAIERGCELIEEGVAIIKVAAMPDDALFGTFLPLDAQDLKRHRDCRYRR